MTDVIEQNDTSEQVERIHDDELVPGTFAGALHPRMFARTAVGQVHFPDLSRWNTVNISKISAGIVFHKAGGSDAGRYTDSHYVRDAAAIRAEHKILGAYWFNGAGNAVTDAAYFATHLSKYEAGDWLILDIEGEGSGKPWSPGSALAFFREVHRRQPKARLMAYMSSSVTREHDWSGLVKYGVHLWVANYGMHNNGAVPAGIPSIAHWASPTVWQYTSQARISGVDGFVDMNIANASVFTGSSKPKPAPKPKPKPAPNKPGKVVRYRVRSGDNLSTIARKYGIDWKKLYAANKHVIGSNPNVLKIGTVLTIPSR